MIKEISDINEVLDFVWKLSQDNRKASYHKINSRIQLIEKLDHAIKSHTQRLIACYKNHVLKGVCLYFWIDKEKYAQTTVFVIDTDYNIVADEIIGQIQKELIGYELLIGVPFDNINANRYFECKNIECIEASYDTRLKSKNYICNNVKENIESIDLNSFDEYSSFHAEYAGDMYWTSGRLKENIDDFRIFVYRYEGKISGSIFVKKYAEGAEVFGLFLHNNFKDKGIDSDLIHYMLKSLYAEYDDIREVVYFIDETDKEELNTAINIGFKINDTYRCYKVRP